MHSLRLLLLASILLPSFAEGQTPRILLVGDSWTARAWRNRAFRTALANRGLSQFEERGGVTAIGGTTAPDWASEPFLELITEELEAHPTIDIVHLSVGGNDFLQNRPTNPVEGFLALINILWDTQRIVDHIHEVRPEARIAYAVYDYIPADHGYGLELGILALGVGFQAWFEPNFFLLNSLGVLHHAFGFPGAFGPGDRPLPGGYPHYSPLFGGDLRFPGSTDLFDDPIHPNETGLVRLAEHAIDEFYRDWLTSTVATDVQRDPTASSESAGLNRGASND